MTDVDEHGRSDPPLDGDEAATLLGFLDYQRATFEWKCGGVDSRGMQATIASSTMTLGGLLKHLAYVEHDWFTNMLRGEATGEPWASADWDHDRDWEWHTAASDSPSELVDLWRREVASAREKTAAALAEGPLGQPGKGTWPDGRSPSLRWILTHMIEEYARHNGHADLLREAVDGVVGE